MGGFEMYTIQILYAVKYPKYERKDDVFVSFDYEQTMKAFYKIGKKLNRDCNDGLIQDYEVRIIRK